MVKSNGLFPVWNKDTEKAIFELINIECALLRFSIFEKNDVIGSDLLLAQATFPISCLRKG